MSAYLGLDPLFGGIVAGGDPAGRRLRRTSGSSAMTFTNPVYARNFPDPGVIHIDGTWFAYGTNDATANVPLLTSTDLAHWTGAGDVLPEVGSWATLGNTWAPEVVGTAAGKYV